MISAENRRILIVDDNPSIHDDFKKILSSQGGDLGSLDAKAAELFGQSEQPKQGVSFEIDSAFQGEDGLEKIANSRLEGRPYAAAFIDIRMPPGIDGVETIERAWNSDPDLHFVICSAYSDYKAHDIIERLAISDRLLMLRKPCDMEEILLLATTLCHKWNVAQILKSVYEAQPQLQQQTAALQHSGEGRDRAKSESVQV